MLLMNNKIKTGGFLNSLKKREQILSSYSDEYITSVVRNLYSSTSTYIIKDMLCELFMEDVSDRVVEKFLEVRENVQINEYFKINNIHKNANEIYVKYYSRYFGSKHRELN